MPKNMKRAERRKNNVKKALRKQKITREVYPRVHDKERDEWEWFDNLHQYSKNKIHCSCPKCSGLDKTNTKNMRGKGHAVRIAREAFKTTNKRHGKNWKPSDYRKIEKFKQEMEEI